MSHLDEATLLSLRDGEAVADEGLARTHLEGCADCRSALDDLRGARSAVSAALSTLDEPFDVEDARARVRARVAEATARAAAGPSLVRPRRIAYALARAAGVLLVVTAGANAKTGSPVRDWVRDLVAPDPTPVRAPAERVTPIAPPDTPEPAGIRVGLTPPARVSLLGLSPGDEVTVRWIPGSEVAVFAGERSRFSSSASLVRASVDGGPVRVDLPQGVRPLVLEVDGRVWIRSVEGALETRVEPVERRDGMLRFVVPGAGGA